MKLFIYFDENGQILSMVKVSGEEGALQNPFMHVEQQERVLEMDATEEFQALDAHEIAEQYTVDTKSRTLRKQKQAGTAPPEKKQKSAVKKTLRKSEK